MKLSNSYNPKDYIIPENVLYKYVQKAFFDNLMHPPHIDSSREHYSKNGKEYYFNPEEKEFYGRQFIALTEPVYYKSSKTLQKYFSEQEFKGIKISRSELDLLEFLEIPENNCVILGDVGYGKTTRIRYTYFYAYSKSSKLKKLYLPLYFALDLKKAELEKAYAENNFDSALYDILLKSKLQKATNHFSQVENNDFWNYLKKHDEFSDLLVSETNLGLRFSEGSKKYNKKLYKKRCKYQANDKFLLTALKYLREELKVTPIIILDNADPLDANLNGKLLWQVAKFSQDFNLKTIISLRTNTYWKIFNSVAGLNEALVPSTSRTEKPKSEKYIKSKLELIKEDIKEYKLSILDGEGKVISSSDILKIYQSMIDIMLHKECDTFFSNIASGDLRRLNRLLRKYFQTGYIHDHDLVWKVVGHTVQEKRNQISEYDIPLWVALSSIITNNHQTFFSQFERDREQDIVINILCNGPNSINTYLIRLNILSFLMKKEKADIDEIRHCHSKIFAKETGDDKNSSINHALRRMLNCKLISSDEFYQIETDDEAEKLKDVSISDLGKYYLNSLTYYFEYLTFMKDDVYIDDDDKIEFQDCIKANTRSKKYKQLLIFLEFFFEKEKKFVLGMDNVNRKQYLRSCSPSKDMFYFSYRMVESMMDFGNARPTLISNSKKFQDLLKSIRLSNRRIISSLKKS